MTAVLRAQYLAEAVPIIAEELECIERWTADGRAPTKKERLSLRGSRIVNEILDAGPLEMSGWAERVGMLEYYFHCWLDDDALRTTFSTDIDLLELSHEPPDRSVDDRTRAALVAAPASEGITELERLLRAGGVWSDQPIDPAKLRFSAPFAADTMTFAEWLQFMFVPRVRQLLASNGPWPADSQVGRYARGSLPAVPGREAIITLLERIDRIFTTI